MSEEDDTMCMTSEVPEIVSSTISNSIQENQTNVTLIWFHPTMNTIENVEQIKEDLCAIDNRAVFHTDSNLFIDDVKSRTNERIFLILSADSVYAQDSTIDHCHHIKSLFIFPANQEDVKRIYYDFPKTVNISDDHNELIQAIKDEIPCVQQQSRLDTFHYQHQQGTRDLSEQSAEFLWFRLFMDVIRSAPHDNEAKTEMLAVCRKYYQGNPRYLGDIEKFDEDYCIDECIRWYTRDTFVYKLINMALRTEDIEQLYIFRFYIADLSKQLAQGFEQIKIGAEKQRYLYRGSIIDEKEIEKLQANITNLIATNGYWSTSSDRQCALTFARKMRYSSQTLPILFEIKCNLHDCADSIVFADISSQSAFPTEREFLFDAGSVFRIVDVRKEMDHGDELHVVQLESTVEAEELTKRYIERNKKQMEQEGPKIMLSIILKRIGKFEKSLEFLQRLLVNPGNEKIAYIHNRIGIELKDKGDYDEAARHLGEAFRLTFDSEPPDIYYSAFVLHNQGLLHIKKNEYEKALSLCKGAVIILNSVRDEETSGIAQFFSTIGRIYSYQNDLENAFEYQFKALEIRKRIMPDHVMTAFSYEEIGDLYGKQKNYDEALQYYLQASDLMKKVLLPDNHKVAWNHRRIGGIYQKLKKPQLALESYEKALQIIQKYAGTDIYYDTHGILEDIAFIYESIGEKKSALVYYKKALEFPQKHSTVGN